MRTYRRMKNCLPSVVEFLLTNFRCYMIQLNLALIAKTLSFIKLDLLVMHRRVHHQGIREIKAGEKRKFELSINFSQSLFGCEMVSPNPTWPGCLMSRNQRYRDTLSDKYSADINAENSAWRRKLCPPKIYVRRIFVHNFISHNWYFYANKILRFISDNICITDILQCRDFTDHLLVEIIHFFFILKKHCKTW